MELQEKVALVTGIGKGIGRATALLFSREGASIVGVDIDDQAGQAIAAEIEKTGQRAIYLSGDVSKASDAKRAVETAVAVFGKLDILFNNAGIHKPKSVESLTEEEWDSLMNVNAKSVFLFSKYALPELRKTKGTIINMSSLVGLTGQRNSAGYSASKAAIIALTKSMALDWASEGIRVNCICPAAVRTPLLEWWLEQRPDKQELQERLVQMHPLGRVAEAEEIAQVALFLASERASFLTGVAIPVDGGASLGF